MGWGGEKQPRSFATVGKEHDGDTRQDLPSSSLRRLLFAQAANIIVSKGYAATAKSLWIFPPPGILAELQAKSIGKFRRTERRKETNFRHLLFKQMHGRCLCGNINFHGGLPREVFEHLNYKMRSSRTQHTNRMLLFRSQTIRS